MVRRLLTPDRILTAIGAIAAAAYSVLHVAGIAHADIRIHKPGDPSASASDVRLAHLRPGHVGESGLAGAGRTVACPEFLIEIGQKPAHGVRIFGDPCKAIR